MSMSTTTLKRRLTPARYLSAHLPGSFGKPTGQGWHIWNGLCPFHQDKKSGSLVVNKDTGAFKCFSCHAGGGDIIAFHMQANGLSFKQSLKQLKETAQ